MARVQALAVVGKNNNPLLVRSFGDGGPGLRFDFVAHAACDVIEERVAPGTKNFDLYLGLLFVLEDLAVFGYMTNTRIKFVLMVAAADVVVKDHDAKTILRKAHAAYVDLLMNPFLDPDAQLPIQSKRFLSRIDEIASTVNQQ